jgi:flagellar L-ring protein precursor FlgH
LKKIIIAIFGIIIFLFTGCTSHQVAPQMSMKPPHYVEHPAPPPQSIKVNDGSAFGRGENPIFADAKAMRVNDVVTVRINETTFQSSQGNKNTKISNQNNFGGIKFDGLLKGINRVADISFNPGSENSFKGSGQNSRNEKFSTTITARIIKILSSGNYFIFGSRELLLNGEKQLVKISGVIRPYDIDQYNTIDSQYIADAKILYETQGDIRESIRKPWGSKIMESVWPF